MLARLGKWPQDENTDNTGSALRALATFKSHQGKTGLEQGAGLLNAPCASVGAPVERVDCIGLMSDSLHVGALQELGNESCCVPMQSDRYCGAAGIYAINPDSAEECCLLSVWVLRRRTAAYSKQHIIQRRARADRKEQHAWKTGLG